MSAKVPIYIHVYSKLRKAIIDGVYAVGDKIPSEAELEIIYGVSRITIRKAVNLLSSDGYVSVRQGLGTIVASPSMHNSNYVSSFTEDLLSSGYVPAAVGINFSRTIIPDVIAKYMNVPKTKEMICVQRLELADAQPIAYMTNYIFPELVPDIEHIPANFTSLYAHIEKHYGISINASRDFISARVADLPLSQTLCVPVGSPLIYLVRVSFSDGQPVLGDIVYINAYKYEFSFNRVGKAPHLLSESI